MNRTNSPN